MTYLRLSITDEIADAPAPLPFPGVHTPIDLSRLETILDEAQARLDSLKAMLDEEIESFKFPAGTDDDDDSPWAA